MKIKKERLVKKIEDEEKRMTQKLNELQKLDAEFKANEIQNLEEQLSFGLQEIQLLEKKAFRIKNRMHFIEIEYFKRTQILIFIFFFAFA